VQAIQRPRIVAALIDSNGASTGDDPLLDVGDIVECLRLSMNGLLIGDYTKA
jgi:hypothetical protein